MLPGRRLEKRVSRENAAENYSATRGVAE